MQLDTAQILETSTRFVIERELGHGGMGVVYQAFDRDRGARVALKALNQIDAAHIYRLKHEFRQLADLSHPNLVTLHELVHEGEAWFFTMELVDGQTFDHYCWERGNSTPPDAQGSEPPVTRRYLRDVSTTLSQPPLISDIPRLPRMTGNERRIRRALQQLVEAINALHEAGRLHRDIKPSNVLVAPDGRVVVLDFGLVSRTNGDSIDPDRALGGSVFGTPAYMSPEQAVGEPLSPASDWYSVGAMLYEALTGQLPFDGTILEILRQKDELEPIPPSELARDVPADLDRLCCDLLRRDPAARPSGSDILAGITDRSSLRPAFDGQSATVLRPHGELFVGRSQQLDELRDAFRAACSGKPVAVLVHGDSGMGKTALVRRFANELIQDGDAVVLRGRCYERESVPYKAFDDIADALARYLIGLDPKQAATLVPRNAHALPLLFPVLRRARVIADAPAPRQAVTDARELRNQAFGALKELLLRISDLGPLVINIDDLQWADLDSARLLSFLLGPPEAPPLLLVATYRREAEQGPFLQQLLTEGPLADGTVDLRKLAIDPLCQADAEELAGVLLRDQRADDLTLRSSLAAEAQGAPFFIAELVRHRQLRLERGAAPATLSLEGVLLDRISSLPEGARQLLHVLSVAGGPLEQGVAIDAARLPRGDRTATMALRAARLIRTRGTRETDTAEAYHDRIRETVVHGLSDTYVRDLHQQIAETLQLHDIRDPERLIPHYAGAGDSRRAGEAAIAAARLAVEKLGFNRAAELFRHAIDFLPANDPQRPALYEQMGDALANAGRGAQAAEAYLKSADGQSAMPFQLALRIVQQQLRSGRVEQGMAMAQKLARSHGVKLPSSTLDAVRTWVVETHLRPRIAPFARQQNTGTARDELAIYSTIFQEVSVVDAVLGAAMHARYATLAPQVGDAGARARAQSWSVYHLSLMGGERRAARARALVAELEALASTAQSPEVDAWLLIARASIEFWSARFPACERFTREADEILRSRCPGSGWEQGWVALLRLTSMELSGNLKPLLSEAPHRERDARERDDSFALGLMALPVCIALLATDQPEQSLSFLREHSRRLGPGFTTFHHLAYLRTVDTLLYMNRPQEALDRMNERWKELTRSALFRARFMRGVSHYQRARCLVALWQATGDASLLTAAQLDLKLCKASGLTYDGYGLALEASIAEHQGNRRRAVELLQAAEPLLVTTQAETYVRRRLGLLQGDEPGLARAQAAADQLRAQGVVLPDRWIAMHIGRSRVGEH